MFRKRPGLFLSLCLIAGEPLLAQQGPPAQPTQPSPQGGNTQQSTPNRQVERSLYLSGSVVYVDGTPADTSVVVELRCDGRVRRQVNTNGGRFNLELGGPNNRIRSVDASMSGDDVFGPVNPTGAASLGSLGSRQPGGELGGRGPGHVSLVGCELRANQAGFQSESITLSFRGVLDNPNVGVIVLHRAGSIRGTSTSVNTMSAPKKARNHHAKALKEVRKKKANYKKAAGELEKAVQIYPEFAEAWQMLGQVRLKAKDPEGAREAFESALASDPNYVKPYVAMIELEYQQQRWDKLSQRSSRLSELNPHSMLAHYYQGFASIKLGRMDVAQESLVKVRTSPQADEYPYASYMLGVLLAGKKSFGGAARELRHYLKMRPEAPEGSQIKAYLRDLEEKGLIESTPGT